jgi:hypothetical protein
MTKGAPMKQCKLLLVGAIVAGLVPSVSTLAVAQSRSGLSIADNDGIFLDGRSFEVIPGVAKGNASAAIEQLGARELGPAAIAFRKGDKLYLAMIPPDQHYSSSNRREYGDNGYRDYGGNGRRDYGDNGYRDYGGNGRRDYGDNGYRDYGGNGRRDYGDNGYRDYGDNGYRDYASDRRAGEAGPRADVGDPDYARYRLRKRFYEYWGANDTK